MTGPLWVVVETSEEKMVEIGNRGNMMEAAGVFSRDVVSATALLRQFQAQSLFLNHIPKYHYFNHPTKGIHPSLLAFH